MGIAAWTRHRPSHPAELRGFVANRARVFVSGLASPGGKGPDRVGMEELGPEPAGKVLPADHGGEKAASRGTVEMEAFGENDRPGNASGLTRHGGLMMRWRFWRRRRLDEDVNDEIAFDLAADAEERIRSGIPRKEAEDASHRDFGNVLLLKENLRETWGWVWLETLFQD